MEVGTELVYNTWYRTIKNTSEIKFKVFPIKAPWALMGRTASRPISFGMGKGGVRGSPPGIRDKFEYPRVGL